AGDGAGAICWTQAPAATASEGIGEPVIGVPTAMTKVETTPVQNSPCASANTSTRIAPEHGRKPTATIAESPRFHPPGPASSSGSGACACPQAEASSCACA